MSIHREDERRQSEEDSEMHRLRHGETKSKRTRKGTGLANKAVETHGEGSVLAAWNARMQRTQLAKGQGQCLSYQDKGL